MMYACDIIIAMEQGCSGGVHPGGNYVRYFGQDLQHGCTRLHSDCVSPATSKYLCAAMATLKIGHSVHNSSSAALGVTKSASTDFYLSPTAVLS